MRSVARARVLLALVAFIVVGSVAPPASAGTSPISVLYGGAKEPGSATQGRFCHDMAYPVIRCFGSAPEAEADETLLSSALATSTVTAYVRMYEHQNYGGVWIDLYYDYQDFSPIGWNDRTSSFKGLNCQLGTFWEHINWTGGRYDFGCNQWVSYVGSAWNDKFSSSYRR